MFKGRGSFPELRAVMSWQKETLINRREIRLLPTVPEMQGL